MTEFMCKVINTRTEVISEPVNSSCSSELAMDKKKMLPPSQLEHNTEIMDNELNSTVLIFICKPIRLNASQINIECDMY